MIFLISNIKRKEMNLKLLYEMHEQWPEQAAEQTQDAITKALLGARDAMLRIRYHMRQMGEAAGVPVCHFFHLICNYMIH